MFDISRNTLDEWLKLREATGQVSPKVYRSRGPAPKIADLIEFRCFASTRGHLTQQQMADEWPEPVSNRTIGKALKEIGFTRKKTYEYCERYAKKRQTFLQDLAHYEPSQVVYIDAAGVDDTEDYPYGYCPRSDRFHALKLGHGMERISMVAAWCNRRVLAPMTFKGHCNTELFEAWVEQFLVPALRPDQVVVMDSVSFYKSQHTQTLIEQAGCQVLFLPPYSPDFNKIEKFWVRLKQHLRKILKQFANLWDAVNDVFRELSRLSILL